MDTQKRYLVGIQAGDGAYAQEAVAELRRRLAAARGYWIPRDLSRASISAMSSSCAGGLLRRRRASPGAAAA